MRYLVPACAILLVLAMAAGCTEQLPLPQPTTTPQMPVQTMTTAPPITDPLLTGEWTFTMAIADNSAPRISNNRINLVFSSDGTISGNAGCNNYGATYVITGEQTAYGKTLGIGPVTTTKKYCEGKMDDEQSYILALQRVTAYSIAANKLTLTVTPGNMLSFVRTTP